VFISNHFNSNHHSILSVGIVLDLSIIKIVCLSAKIK